MNSSAIMNSSSLMNSSATNNSVFLNTLFYLMLNQTNVTQDTSYNYYLLKIGKEMNSTKCYGSYGCFELSAPWTSEHRPVSLFPEELQKIEPNFPLYTRKHFNQPVYFDLNDWDMVHSSGINPNLPVYMISHGFVESGDKPWLIEMAQEFLRKEDCSVIIVDWHGGSGPPYTQAVANIRLVGVMAAHLLGDLARYTPNNQLSHVHCVGHSLGAHLCGYVGYTLQKDFNLTLGRITGLDPAEPHFAKAKRPVRLDRSAADFVDVIHTDASAFIRGGLGMTEPVGHVDFYPNGGTDQPGCGKSMVQYISSESGSFFNGIRRYLGCNHLRSHEYFHESIIPKCSYMSIACKSYEDFRNGSCFECGKDGQHCLTFGYNSRQNYEKLLKDGVIKPDDNLILYLMTGEAMPYCKAHYRITAYISNSNESLVHGGEIGQLWFTMHSTSDGKGLNSGRIALNSGGYHAPGASYKSVVAGDGIPQMRAVEVEWEFHSNVFNPLTWRILESPKVHIANITVDALETKQSLTVCPKDDNPLVSGTPLLLSASYCLRHSKLKEERNYI